MTRQCPYCKSKNIGKRGFGGDHGSKFRYLNYCKDCGEVEWWESEDWNIEHHRRKINI